MQNDLLYLQQYTKKTDYSQLPYVGKFWRGKILENLSNGLPFGKIFPTNICKYDEIPEQNYYNNDGTFKPKQRHEENDDEEKPKGLQILMVI